MTPDQLAQRKRIMQRSMALGHCICDHQKPCPCPQFKERNVCECAGERLPVPTGPVRLTQHVRNAGCASKISKRDLEQALAGLPDIDDPAVLIGRSAGDDAGVVLLGGKEATILTVDVFCPSVDDPYTFGRIAAANSLSDVYAMGGTPRAALSIIGFPVHSLPLEVMRAMLRGGIDTMAEAGISVVGGHSINDEEPKLGFAVTGTVSRRRLTANRGCRPGDALVLTKALGVGIVAFAQQIDRASPSTLAAMTDSMCRLNRQAAEAMAVHTVHAVTDVTGFSLLGHLFGMVQGSDVMVDLDFDALPLLPGVDRLARQDIVPGGVERNREGVPADRLDLTTLTPAQEAICFCPETSGGLLVCLPEKAAKAYRTTLRRQGHPAAIVGRVTGTHPGGRIAVQTNRSRAWGQLVLKTRRPAVKSAASPMPIVSCCAEVSPSAIMPHGDCCSQPPATDIPATRVDGVGILPAPSAAAAFGAFMQAVNGDEALDAATTALISLALSVATRCEVCVLLQTKNARAAGASDAAIAKAVSLGIAFGGAPVNMFYTQLAKRCHD